MATGVFGTSISCMDGRIQNVLSDWIKENYKVDHVDTITAPGVDRRIAKGDDVQPLIDMARISVEKHRSRLIVISGHYDCAGNPVSDKEHIGHIKDGVGAIRSWAKDHNLIGDSSGNAGSDVDDSDKIEIVGVWIGETWTVQRIV